MAYVYFSPGFFHHLMGMQKLIDIPTAKKGWRNSTAYIFKKILDGAITTEDIQKSKYFNEIESRLHHFPQIKRMVEFEKVIINFDPSLIRSKMAKVDYMLFKRSNDNMYLNLLLTADGSSPKKHIPLTFFADPTDYYIHGQKVVNIVSMHVTPKNKNSP
ncbi:MAG: PBECR4 domain-containing protein [Firmicutes bacterium]|nr:PBECR4 domain-containing protein [Bacillota bacterium]